MFRTRRQNSWAKPGTPTKSECKLSSSKIRARQNRGHMSAFASPDALDKRQNYISAIVASRPTPTCLQWCRSFLQGRRAWSSYRQSETWAAQRRSAFPPAQRHFDLFLWEKLFGAVLKGCGFLRESAVICDNLCLPNVLPSRKTRESAELSENLRKICAWAGLVPIACPDSSSFSRREVSSDFLSKNTLWSRVFRQGGLQVASKQQQSSCSGAGNCH